MACVIQAKFSYFYRPTMIKTNNLSFSYDGKKRFIFPDVSIRAGESLLILGQSGVGKTTLLHLLAGLMKPMTGSFQLGSENVTSLSGAALDKFRGKNIGIVFQQNHFIDALTVIENLTLAQELSGLKPDWKVCKSLLVELNLDHKLNAKVKQLSEGEKQRASIARALVNNPKLILADEPTSALDDKNCDAVFELLSTQADKIESALIIVTHDSRLKSKMPNHLTLENIQN